MPLTTDVRPPTKGKSDFLSYQTTEFQPAAATDAPQMPPIMEWVKETGNSQMVARSIQIPAQIIAQSMAYLQKRGECALYSSVNHAISIMMMNS